MRDMLSVVERTDRQLMKDLMSVVNQRNQYLEQRLAQTNTRENALKAKLMRVKDMLLDSQVCFCGRTAAVPSLRTQAEVRALQRTLEVCVCVFVHSVSRSSHSHRRTSNAHAQAHGGWQRLWKRQPKTTNCMFVSDTTSASHTHTFRIQEDTWRCTAVTSGRCDVARRANLRA